MEIKEIPLSKIKLGRNSRLDINKDELLGLMESIREIGLLQPIGVKETSTGRYQIVYGNRRYLACSKLGWKRITAVMNADKKPSDGDIKNLAENIQRRNISLVEAGRYMQILKGEGLSNKEMAVRLGVSVGYIGSCLDAYSNVPKEFRNDIVQTSGTTSVPPGKISIRTARGILNARKAFNLTSEQEKVLFKEAKSNDNFRTENLSCYATMLKSGKKKKNVVDAVKPLKQVQVHLILDEDHYNFLIEKYCTNGPFRGLTGLIKAILTGKKSARIKIVE